MQVISWNYRGLGNPIKLVVVKNVLRMAPSEILLLQETKIEEEALLLIRNKNWNLNAGNAVSARGSYGGLATLWRDHKFQLKKVYATQHWIHTELFHHSSKTSYALFNLYVPVNYSEKRTVGKRYQIFLSFPLLPI